MDNARVICNDVVAEFERVMRRLTVTVITIGTSDRSGARHATSHCSQLRIDRFASPPKRLVDHLRQQYQMDATLDAA
jgi:hypothetical protein